MKIAFVNQPFDSMWPPVRVGSLPLWTFHTAKNCSDRGHQIAIFGNHGKLHREVTIAHDGIHYFFTPTFIDSVVNRTASLPGRIIRKISSRSGPDHSVSGAWHHWGYAREVAKRIRSLRSDVVHVMNYSQFIPVIRRYNPTVRIVLHMHCEWLTQFTRAIIEPRLRQTDLIIGCSEYITKTICDAYPKFAGNLVTVPNSTDVVLEDTASQPAGNRVLFVGRLSPEKGIHDLITAFHTVLQHIPDASLHLVGNEGAAPLRFLVGLSNLPHVQALRRFYDCSDNPGCKDSYLTALEKLAGQELGKRIIFEGHSDHDKIHAHYRNAALLVNASLSESFGISVIEAMMFKIPVVATRIGGMQHTVIPGETGILVDPAKPSALADAMIAVLTDSALARRMGKAARARAVCHFSWERSADQLLQAYEVAERRPRLYDQ